MNVCTPTPHLPAAAVAVALACLAALSTAACDRSEDGSSAAETTETPTEAPAEAPAEADDTPEAATETETATDEELTPHKDQTPVQTRPAPAAGNTAPEYGPVSTRLSRPPAALAKAFTLKRVATGLKRPVALEHAPGDTTGRLYAVEQHVARIRVLEPDGEDRYKVAKEPFLSLKGKVSKGNEQGLLGLAFHPSFADNRRLFVYYTDRKGTTRVIEYRADEAGDRADMSAAREIFSLEQPYSNHNAGDLEFGPDGKLYVGTGDGGAAGDPLRAGQDRKSLLAKMLRFDVDAAASGPVKPEMVQLGLRNPWRYSFDAKTGDLYIGDVGQNEYEFVYAVAGDDLEGHNFGWNVTEGDRCYRRKKCDKSKFTPVAVEYSHKVGCSITGGEVYRGKAIPELDGVYFYADYCTSIIRSFRWAKDGVRQHWRWRKALDPRKKVRDISSFGHDADGELYVVSLKGSVYRLSRR